MCSQPLWGPLTSHRCLGDVRIVRLSPAWTATRVLREEQPEDCLVTAVEGDDEVRVQEAKAIDHRVGNLFVPRIKKWSLSRWVLGVFIGSEERKNLERVEQFEDRVREYMIGKCASDTLEKVCLEEQMLTGQDRKLVAVPKFVALATCALRAKFGVLDIDVVGNDKTINEAISRLLAKYNVREVDRACHRDLIFQCFFEEDAFSRIPQTRKRLAQKSWLYKWLLGQKTRKAAVF